MKATMCSIDGCDKPNYQKRDMCGSHFMRQYRYGDALHAPHQPYRDLTGERFGTLVAKTYHAKTGERPAMWLCLCDCGRTKHVRAGDLRSGNVQSCAALEHQRQEIVGYIAVRERLAVDRGRAAEHECADCGGQAAQWSYDHTDPNELYAETIKGSPAYSLDAARYQPRCVPCHKRFDLRVAA